MHQHKVCIVPTELIFYTFLVLHISSPCCHPRGRLHSLCWQQVNANTHKTVQVKDFGADEVRQLNATLQLDWKLFSHFAVQREGK